MNRNIRLSPFLLFVVTTMLLSCLALNLSPKQVKKDFAKIGLESQDIPFTNKDSFSALFDDSLLEVPDPISLQVIGSIPSYVNGILLRNGPAMFGALPSGNLTRRRYSHVFDGLSKLSRYEIKDGKVKFSTRFLQSTFYRQVIEGNDVPPGIYAGETIPPPSLWGKILAVLKSKDFDNTPVHVHNFGDGETNKWFATTDAPILMEFDPSTLTTVGRATLKNSAVPPGYELMFCTAHPHQRRSKSTNRKYTYNYNFLRQSSMRWPWSTQAQNIINIVRTDTSLNTMVVGAVNFPDGNYIPYVHDFSLTENYAILALWPTQFNMQTLINGKGFMPQMGWKPELKTKIYVFDISKFDDVQDYVYEPGNVDKQRVVDPIAYFEASPLFAYHHINAYEERYVASGEVNIVMDVTGYETAAIANGEYGFAYINNMRDPELRKKEERDGTCFRFRLPLSPSIISQTSESNPLPVKVQALKAYDSAGLDYTNELVRINPNYEQKPYRFSYGPAGFAGEDETRGGYMEWGILKQDHLASEQHLSSSSFRPSAFIWKQKNCYPSECLFVPHPRAQSEDDGVLLSQVYDADKMESFLLVLDAKTMREVARAYTGMIIPVSFHGQFTGFASTA